MIRQSRSEPKRSAGWAFVRKFFKVVAAMLLCVGGAAAYTALAPVYYGSEAKLFVRLGRESVALDPTATTGQTVSVQDSRETELNSVQELLTSRVILEKVVDDFGPAFILGGAKTQADEKAESHDPPSMLEKLNPLTTYSRRDSAVQKLSKQLSVTNAKKSSVLTISCEGPTPEAARQIVQKVIELARDAHTQVNRTAGSLQFFTEQTAAEGKRLAGLETRLHDLKNGSGIASLEQQREIRLKQIGTLEEEQHKTDRALLAADASRRVLQARLGAQAANVVTSETTGLADTAAARMREQLYTLQIKQHELESRLTDDNPLIVQIKAQVAEAKAMLDRESTAPQITKGENKTYKDIELAVYTSEANVAALSSEQTSLATQLTDARGAVKSMNDMELKLAGLEREIDSARTTYRRYADNLELARIDQALASERISNINVLQEPTLSYTPTRPRTGFNLSVGFGLGLILAMSLIAWTESRRSSAPRRNGSDRDDKTPAQRDDVRRIVYHAK